MLKLLDNKRAFTLLEVLLAAVVLSVGLVYMFPIFFRSADATAHLGKRLTVTRLLDNAVWEAREHLVENPGVNYFSYENVYEGRLPVSVRTSLRLLEGYDDLYKVSVRAEWEERAHPRSFEREVFLVR